VVLLACWLTLPVRDGVAADGPVCDGTKFFHACMVLALVGMLDFTERSGASAEAAAVARLLLWAGSMVVAAAMHPLMRRMRWEQR